MIMTKSDRAECTMDIDDYIRIIYIVDIVYM